MKTLKPRKPFIETWKCIRKPCPKTTTTIPTVTLKPKILPLKSKNKTSNRRPQIDIQIVEPINIRSLPRKKSSVKPVKFERRTFGTVPPGIKLELVKPYTFKPRYRKEEKVRKTTTTTTTTETPRTTPSTTTSTTSSSTTKIPVPEFPYSLLWVSKT